MPQNQVNPNWSQLYDDLAVINETLLFPVCVEREETLDRHMSEYIIFLNKLEYPSFVSFLCLLSFVMATNVPVICCHNGCRTWSSEKNGQIKAASGVPLIRRLIYRSLNPAVSFSDTNLPIEAWSRNYLWMNVAAWTSADISRRHR